MSWILDLPGVCHFRCSLMATHKQSQCSTEFRRVRGLQGCAFQVCSIPMVHFTQTTISESIKDEEKIMKKFSLMKGPPSTGSLLSLSPTPSCESETDGFGSHLKTRSKDKTTNLESEVHTQIREKLVEEDLIEKSKMQGIF